eukprot:TRINITY_DN4696_c0_g1_i1.p1 TRINITY_DN4696_c0_g1~~TRINITY_DN4696_c0_g1_i1.p1  ORF type:complete len:247 (-),score=14.89 TRINITY_DN4696_c0_g1_i1:117-857(-)
MLPAGRGRSQSNAANEWATYHRCGGCQKWLAPENFSIDERLKGPAAARCTTCAGEEEITSPTSISDTKSESSFSKASSTVTVPALRPGAPTQARPMSELPAYCRCNGPCRRWLPPSVMLRFAPEVIPEPGEVKGQPGSRHPAPVYCCEECYPVFSSALRAVKAGERFSSANGAAAVPQSNPHKRHAKPSGRGAPPPVPTDQVSAGRADAYRGAVRGLWHLLSSLSLAQQNNVAEQPAASNLSLPEQ